MEQLDHAVHRSRTVTCTRVADLPRLGWAARLVAGEWVVVLGPDVEVARSGDRWFEGAWAGPFDAWNFAAASSVFGSGGHVAPDGTARLTGPTHPQEGLSVVRTADALTVANSIVLALWLAGARIDAANRTNVLALIRVVDGLEQQPFRVALEGGGALELHLVRDLMVDPSGTITPLAKPAVEPFNSYEEYTRVLAGALHATVENARSPSRAVSYALITSISSGYDSPACAALAVQEGCTEAFSIDRAKQGPDSGRAVGECLGLRVYERPPAEVDALDEPDLALFHADGFQGEDMTWATCRELLRGRLVVTGFNGDRIWTRHAKARGVFTRAEVSGNSLSLMRITDGWIHLPLPFVGEPQQEAVAAISNSPAMDPWSVGDRYDRPIPRRIAEEAGVARELFGQEKRGVSVNEFRERTRTVPAAEGARRTRPTTWRAARRVRVKAWRAAMWCRTDPSRTARRVRNLADRLRPSWSALDIRLLEHAHPDNLDVWAWACAERVRALPSRAEVI